MWYELKNHAKNIDLGAFVVMPNHVHGILILNGNDIPGTGDFLIDRLESGVCDGANVETLNATSLQQTKPTEQLPLQKTQFMSDISPKSGSVSTIIRSYKSAVSKHAHRLGFVFAWQERFYKNIIRDAESFQTISKYIANNHANWKDDRFFHD